MFSEKLIQKFAGIPTPFYYYDSQLLDQTLKALTSAAAKYNYHIHYAVKANANDRILKSICNYGIGADCVSGNEVAKALETGFPASKIVFAGVGKRDDEIELAIENNIFSFNCESLQEIEVIDQLAGKRNKIANIAIRINPKHDAHTHHYITTGTEENKFGIVMDEMPELIAQLKLMKNIQFIGIHFHIGSQITDLSVFEGLCLKVNSINQWFADNGLFVKHLNMGGGIGIDYHHPENNMVDFAAFFDVIYKNLKVQPDQQVHFELGRSIVGSCGSLITKVLFVKKGTNTSFVIVDAGFTELIRPALYHSYHKIENICSDLPSETYDVVGPICESTDSFAKAYQLPQTHRGDLLAIRSAGAYGQVMASQYNLRELVKGFYTEDLM